MRSQTPPASPAHATTPYADTALADDLDLAALLTTLGLDPLTLRLDDKGTIVPTAELPRTHDELLLARLRPLVLTHDSQLSAGGLEGAAQPALRLADVGLGEGPSADLRLGKTIGEGGMGVVRVAEQVALGRDVAVKSLRDGETRGEAMLALLREAWVTGSLEHPAVVPVHTLGRGPNDAPMLVMKRIVGESWSALLADPRRLPADRRRDPLGFHLEVLMTVCNAVAFAHARNVLHRDLKPDNVMVGAFGEVYVLDWGLAVALPGGDPRLPQVSEVRTIAGTPHFMAPEMVAVDAHQLDARTDVYLLGAILHMVLTGAPRHRGGTPMELLAAAWRSPPPTFADDVPAELAAICAKATAKEPDERFASVVELRAALAAFVEHRHSLELTRATRKHLRTLKRLLAQVARPGDASSGALDGDTASATATGIDGDTASDTATSIDDDSSGDNTAASGGYGKSADPADLHNAIATAYSACRFGFQLALQSWPDNSEARQGFDAALDAMIDNTIAIGDLRVARLLVAERGSISPEVQDRLDALAARLDAERALAAERERKVIDGDLRYGSRTRALLALAMSVVFGGSAAVLSAMEAHGALTWSHGHNVAFAAGFMVFLGVFTFWARQTLSSTRYNRDVVVALAGISLMALLTALGFAMNGAEPLLAQRVLLLVFAAFMTTFGATMDRRLMLGGAAYALAYLAAMRWPVHTLAALAVGNTLGTFVVAWAWRPRIVRGTYDGDTRALRQRQRGDGAPG